MENYPIYIDGEARGELQISRQGLYTLFSAHAEGREPLHLWLYGGGKQACLGRMLPRNGALTLRRKLSKNDMRGFPAAIDYAGQEKMPDRETAADGEEGLLWFQRADGTLASFDGERLLIAFPARLRDRERVKAHIRSIDGREYLVFRR